MSKGCESTKEKRVSKIQKSCHRFLVKAVRVCGIIFLMVLLFVSVSTAIELNAMEPVQSMSYGFTNQVLVNAKRTSLIMDGAVKIVVALLIFLWLVYLKRLVRPEKVKEIKAENK